VWIGDEGLVHVGDRQAAFRLADGRFTTTAAMPPPRDGGENLVGVVPEAVVRQVARRRDGTVAAATSAGLFERDADGPWRRLAPVDSTGLVWAASDVRGVAYDSHDRLVVVVPAGIARRGARRSSARSSRPSSAAAPRPWPARRPSPGGTAGRSQYHSPVTKRGKIALIAGRRIKSRSSRRRWKRCAPIG
jgi:hypothetical protein